MKYFWLKVIESARDYILGFEGNPTSRPIDVDILVYFSNNLMENPMSLGGEIHHLAEDMHIWMYIVKKLFLVFANS